MEGADSAVFAVIVVELVCPRTDERSEVSSIFDIHASLASRGIRAVVQAAREILPWDGFCIGAGKVFLHPSLDVELDRRSCRSS